MHSIFSKDKKRSHAGLSNQKTGTLSRLLLGALLAMVILAPGPGVAAGPLVDLSKVAPTEDIVFAVKDGGPLILVDMAGETEHFQSLAAKARQEYLAKRALIIVAGQALARPDYKGMDTFKVKLVEVVDYDDYDQPKWFTADHLGSFRVTRSAAKGLKLEQINAMGLDALAKHIALEKK